MVRFSVAALRARTVGNTRMKFLQMLPGTCDLEIPRSVVTPIAVDMVYVFIGKQPAPQCLRQHKAVLQDPPMLVGKRMIGYK